MSWWSSGGPDRVARVAREWPVAAAALFGVLATSEIALRAAGSGPRLLTALLLGLCATAPVAVARAHLVPATLAATAAILLTLGTGLPLPAAALAGLAILGYLVGRHRSGMVAVLLVAPVAGYAVAALAAPDRLASQAMAVVVAGTVTAGSGLGAFRRVRGAAAQRQASWQAVADTLLEHAARGERARIARELHDVVAHHISMIAVQAETARLATPGLPADGARQLRAIGDTARTALTEMRRLLGVLREDIDGSPPSREPQPGLSRLVELIDQARDASGASVRLIVRGRVGPLEPGVELTAYRIVQEALTNARRHAPGAAVDVTLDYLGDALQLRVRDNGVAAAPPGGAVPPAGHGLLGMRERVAAVGGELTAGPGPVCGFLVTARLPVPAPAPLVGAP